MYIIEIFMSRSFILISNQTMDYLAFGRPTIAVGLYYTLITAIFAHANFAHLGGNLLFLLVYGLRLEEENRHKDVYLSFFASATVGHIFTYILLPDVVSLGASGGVFGLLGTALMYNKKRYPREGRKIIFTGVAMLILAGTSASVNPISHLFGLATGVLIGWYLYFHRGIIEAIPPVEDEVTDR